MIKFESSIQIKRPASDIFFFVADQENNPKWNYYVTRVRKTSDGALGVGTTFQQTRKTDTQELRIVTCRPPQMLSIETIPPSRLEVKRTIEFDEQDGTTLLTDSVKLDTGHPQFLQRLAAGKIKSTVKVNLAKLKELLETGNTKLQDGRNIKL